MRIGRRCLRERRERGAEYEHEKRQHTSHRTVLLSWKGAAERGAGLRGFATASPFLEQARRVARNGVERRIPAERAGPRAADDLIERQRFGIRAHLVTW